MQAEFAEVSVGSLERVEQFKSELVPDRTVEIWLPDGYSADNDYAVVYMHDGQMLFDESKTWNGQEWHVDETAQKLIDEGAVAPFIVVGIFNGDAHRHNEYFPQKPFENLPKTLQETLYEQSRGAGHGLFARSVNSDNYLKFIVHEVRPYIESTYSVDSKRSYLMGSSMGGLISWYGLLEYPEVFA
ncbi:alpha/beta hydrolase [Alteromonas gracilis]|uniref:alpha/beta hydrolase n=1 Tax=Alteromonas gracilis TaxID=1479524 RepID=UPI00321B92AD